MICRNKFLEKKIELIHDIFDEGLDKFRDMSSEHKKINLEDMY